jgi:hypothetical protein
VLRPEFLVGMIARWITSAAGGAALGAAFRRQDTSTSDLPTIAAS